MRHTPEEFVHWLRSYLEEMQQTERQLTHAETEIYQRAVLVDSAESLGNIALSEHEKYMSFVQAGFTETQAFQILLSDRTAMVGGAIRESIIQDRKEKNQN